MSTVTEIMKAAGRLAELAAAELFLVAQRAVYADAKDCDQRVWTDLCQMVLASNAFLYVE